jgi:electron transfer flavoprotein alpha subunit
MMERVLCVGADLRPDPGLVATARELGGLSGVVAAVRMASGDRSGPTVSADRIYEVAASDLDAGRGDHVGAVVVAAARAFEATIVLSSSTKVSREGIARAGALLKGPVLTGARAPRVTDDGIEVSRDFLSGNATALECAVIRPVLLALAEGPIKVPPEFASGPAPEMVPLSVELPPYPFRRVSLKPKPARDVDLEAADRVVSVGRGIQRKEDLSLIDGLAAALGAAVGCTRPIAAESGWLTDDHWVGLTGHRVRPSLYVAVGISGAAQHLVGMRDSKVVVAINRDANAPIFQQADYQVVGDLYAIVPELTRRLAEAARSSSKS